MFVVVGVAVVRLLLEDGGSMSFVPFIAREKKKKKIVKLLVNHMKNYPFFFFFFFSFSYLVVKDSQLQSDLFLELFEGGF